MRTKMIVTVGPATMGAEMLEQLVEEGVRIFRLNFSHGSARSFRPVVSRIRRIESERGVPLTVLQDLAGPKHRIGELREQTMELSKGDELVLGPAERVSGLPGAIPFEEVELVRTLRQGDVVVLSDGSVQLGVVELKEDIAHLEALNNGMITSRKGIAFPGKRTSQPALTDKDRRDLAEAVDEGLAIDAVAISFVQHPEDVDSLRRELDRLGRRVPILSKLERQSALEQLDLIIERSDAILLARGDLGIDCPLEMLPELQKRIIRSCNRKATPVIVATQMLLSMVTNPVPTRAETTDVANAVLDGADCLMLSEETAIGSYPIESVGYMRRIANNAEDLFFEQETTPLQPYDSGDPIRFLAYGACLVAEKSSARGLVAHTVSGATALLLAGCRPKQPIHAISPLPEVVRSLNLAWGVTPHGVEEEIDDHLHRAERFIETSPIFSAGDKAVITAGHTRPGEDRTLTNVIKLYERMERRSAR
jgi:pyruvate kinase